MQGKGCHTLDDSDANTLYDRPDVDTLLRLHDYQAMPEVFCCDYRLLRRPPVEVVKEKLPGEIYSPNLGLTVPTGKFLSGTVLIQNRSLLQLRVHIFDLQDYAQDAVGGGGPGRPSHPLLNSCRNTF